MEWNGEAYTALHQFRQSQLLSLLFPAVAAANQKLESQTCFIVLSVPVHHHYQIFPPCLLNPVSSSLWVFGLLLYQLHYGRACSKISRNGRKLRNLLLLLLFGGTNPTDYSMDAFLEFNQSLMEIKTACLMASFLLIEVSRVNLSVFHLEVEIQVVTLETTGDLHSSSLLAVQTLY